MPRVRGFAGCGLRAGDLLFGLNLIAVLDVHKTREADRRGLETSLNSPNAILAGNDSEVPAEPHGRPSNRSSATDRKYRCNEASVRGIQQAEITCRWGSCAIR